MAAEAKSFLTPMQRYAAGALFAIAVHRAQIHQTRPLGLATEDGDPSTEERTSSSSDSVSEDPERWVHENSACSGPFSGKLLAEVLLKGYQGQGNRSVTLIGYSLGARVIFKCLQVLSETEQNAELVERVVLLGAPISIKGENWEAARKMVAGRFINAYSSNDWMLGVAFRASLLAQGLAGIQPVGFQGIENVKVTDLIECHSSYLWATQKILDRLELDVYYPVFKSTLHEQ